MVVGLHLCPKCGIKVSPFSKCTAEGYKHMYHCGLVDGF